MTSAVFIFNFEWTDYTNCSSIPTVDFEQVNGGC